MAYLKSSNISTFPVVNRDMTVSGDIYARHTTEEVLAGIVNKLIDTDGFVITTKDDFGLDKPFAFNIHGYYFKTKDDNITSEGLSGTFQRIIELFDEDSIVPGVRLYAGITLEKNGQWTELYGQDEPILGINEDPTNDTVYQYTGVKFSLLTADSTAPVSSDTTYWLLLAQFVGTDSEYSWNSGWFVPDESYLKFNGPSFSIDRVDGNDMDDEDSLVTFKKVGGRIYYIDSNANTAEYTFYDKTVTLLSEQTIEGLSEAYYYTKSGTTENDKFFVVNTDSLVDTYINNTTWKQTDQPYNNIEWGAYDVITNANTILGKQNSTLALNKVKSIYPETSTDSTIWKYLNYVNNVQELENCNDWYIPSAVEIQNLQEVATSLNLDWFDTTTGKNIWSSSEIEEITPAINFVEEDPEREKFFGIGISNNTFKAKVKISESDPGYGIYTFIYTAQEGSSTPVWMLNSVEVNLTDYGIEIIGLDDDPYVIAGDQIILVYDNNATKAEFWSVNIDPTAITTQKKSDTAACYVIRSF